MLRRSLIAVGCGACLALVACGSSGSRERPSSHSCRSSNAGVVDDYSAGGTVGRYALTTISFSCVPADPRAVATGLPATGMYSKTYVYGTCRPPASEGGCAPPVEVQLFHACRRNASLYRRYGGAGTPKHRDVTVRGVPGAAFEGGRRVEVYTGRSTIVVWGWTAALANRAVAQLRGTGASAGDNLPQPAQGAMAGRIRCRPRE